MVSVEVQQGPTVETRASRSPERGQDEIPSSAHKYSADHGSSHSDGGPL